MARKRRRRGVSLGTVFMLLLTAMVVAGCVFFLSILVGDGLYEKTGTFIRTLSEQGLFDEAGEEPPRKAPASAPAAEAPADTAVFAYAEPTAEATVTPSAPAPAPSSIHIAVAGTVYAPKAIRESAQDGEQFDFAPVFAGLGDTLSGADLAIATLETTTAGKDKGFGNYNTAPELLDALRASGVDLVSLATEHALDKDYEGLDLTISELTARGLAYAGADPDGKDTGRAAMMRIGGIQVAVLAYAYGLSEESDAQTDGDKRGVLAMMDTQRMAQDITQARVDGANVVIVLPHWGTKNKTQTPDNLRYTARTLAQVGADVILGSHPNVAQGTERLRVTRSDGLEYDAVVCYSLGSLLNDARTRENTAGMIAHVNVTYDPATRHAALGEMYCTPVYIACEKQDGEDVYRVVDAEDGQALAALSDAQREQALGAVEIIRAVTGADEQEGQG